MVDAVQLEQHDDVIARLDLAVDGAIEMSQSLVEGHRALVGCLHRDAVESVLDSSGELSTGGTLVVGENCDAEVCCASKIRPRLGPRRHRDRHEWRVETDAGERACGEAGQLAVDLCGNRDDTGRENAERLAQPRGIEILIGMQLVGREFVRTRFAHEPAFSNVVTIGFVAVSHSAYAAGSSYAESMT